MNDKKIFLLLAIFAAEGIGLIYGMEQKVTVEDASESDSESENKKEKQRKKRNKSFKPSEMMVLGKTEAEILDTGKKLISIKAKLEAEELAASNNILDVQELKKAGIIRGVSQGAAVLAAQDAALGDEDFAIKKGKLSGLEKATMNLEIQKILLERSLREVIKGGAIAGLEQGTAKIVETLVGNFTTVALQTGMSLGIQWWYKEHFKKIAQQKAMQQKIKSISTYIDEQQKNISHLGIVVNTLGSNTRYAQEVFTANLKQLEQEAERVIVIQMQQAVQQKLQKKIQKKNEKLAIEKNNLDLEYEAGLEELKQQLGVIDTPDDVQFKKLEKYKIKIQRQNKEKLEEFEKKISQELLELKHSFEQGFKEKFELAKQQFMQSQRPDMKFLELFNRYADGAIQHVRDQNRLMKSIFSVDAINADEEDDEVA